MQSWAAAHCLLKHTHTWSSLPYTHRFPQNSHFSSFQQLCIATAVSAAFAFFSINSFSLPCIILTGGHVAHWLTWHHNRFVSCFGTPGLQRSPQGITDDAHQLCLAWDVTAERESCSAAEQKQDKKRMQTGTSLHDFYPWWARSAKSAGLIPIHCINQDSPKAMLCIGNRIQNDKQLLGGKTRPNNIQKKDSFHLNRLSKIIAPDRNADSERVRAASVCLHNWSICLRSSFSSSIGISITGLHPQLANVESSCVPQC